MSLFKKSSHLSDILQNSEKETTAIFIHSNNCNTSSSIKKAINTAIKNKKIKTPIYIVTVQEMPVLSKNIEDFLDIKHESPQIIILNKSKVTYHESHHNIDLKKIA